MHHFDNNRRLCVLVLIVSSVLSFQQAHALDVTLKVLKMDTVYADGLQHRLLTGGTEAIDAIEKVSSFIQSGKVELLEEVSLSLKERKLTESRSSDDQFEPKVSSGKIRDILEEQGWKFNRGLTAKMVLGQNDLLIYEIQYIQELKEKPNIYKLELGSEIYFSNTAPLLLHRWEDSTGIYLLTLESDEYAKATSDTEAANHYFRTNYYDSESAARSSNQPTSSILTACTSGRQTTYSITRMIWYFASSNDRNMVALDLGPSSRFVIMKGRSDSSMKLFVANYCHLGDGKVRNEAGARVPKFSQYAVEDNFQLEAETPKLIPLTYQSSSSLEESDTTNWHVKIELVQ